jgi:hypothetical protein
MGNDKFISFEGTPTNPLLDGWTEERLLDVAHATAVALKVKPKGIFPTQVEPAYVLGIVFTSSLSGGHLVEWLVDNLRSGHIWLHDLDWPEDAHWHNNSDGKGWQRLDS